MELAGDGTHTGNSFLINYTPDGVPIFASASNAEGNSVSSYLKPDGSPRELVPQINPDGPEYSSGGISVESLGVDYAQEYLDNRGPIFSSETTWDQLDGGSVFKVITTMVLEGGPMELSWFPERIEKFITTYQVDEETGERVYYSSQAAGVSGKTYLENYEHTTTFEVISELPPDMAALMETLHSLEKQSGG